MATSTELFSNEVSFGETFRRWKPRTGLAWGRGAGKGGCLFPAHHVGRRQLTPEVGGGLRPDVFWPIRARRQGLWYPRAASGLTTLFCGPVAGIQTTGWLRASYEP